MPKEYRTIREVAGPLMMISDVEDVKYDELGEIELPSGETRRCRVLEITGENGRFYICGNVMFSKTHPMLAGIEEDAKEQEQTEGE